ncbi:MAG: peptide chain release factor 2 [Candidatus Porifericomitaceae bacterium WSBS_2022_MAG_OTU9]
MRVQLAQLQQRLASLRGYLDYDGKKKRLTEIASALSDPAVWNDRAKSRELSEQQAALNRALQPAQQLGQKLDDGSDLLTLAAEENDRQVLLELEKDFVGLEKNLAELEWQRMFNGEMDQRNAWLEVQSGSGGTEAQDWAEMLLRMYLRWGERRGLQAEMVEASAGDTAGIRSATVLFKGDYAYGWLRTESGIHRLVRKSPFDSGNRRHTSFASVFVSPEIDDNIEVEIDPSDLRVDTYRASGAGGQHVNRTDSAVRITHTPTSIVVQCQSDRSQHRNRDHAMRQLRARLYELELKKKTEQKQQLEANKSEITWGNQIRSYVLDQSRVKDLRTGLETSNTQGVLDGDITAFMKESLKQGVGTLGS